MANPIVLKVLSGGGAFHYAPLSGGLMLFGPRGKKYGGTIFMNDFLELQEQEIIHIVHSMRQGHGFFHGPVDIYKKK